MIVLSSSVCSDLVEGIAARIGPETEILSTISEARYRRWSSGGAAGRMGLRMLGVIGHPARLVCRVLQAPRGTVFVVTTNPFFAPALAVWAGRRRGQRVVHHVFDLYPDALEAAGAIPAGGWRSRLIGQFTRAAQRGCAGAVYLGAALQRHAERRHGRAATSAVIDVTADEALFGAPAETPPGPLTLHYGGQLGRMHTAGPLAEAVRLLRAEREAGQVRFDFRVGGANAAPLLALAGEPGVTVGPVLPAGEWRVATGAMHIGLVSLTTKGATVCLPSKTYALLAAGMAVLAVAPAASDLAGLVESTGAGWVVDPGDASDAATAKAGAEIAALVRRWLWDPVEVRDRRRAALAAARGRFGREETGRRWHQFLAELR